MELSSSTQQQPVDPPTSTALHFSNLSPASRQHAPTPPNVKAVHKYKPMKIIVVDTEAETIAAALQKINPSIEIRGLYTDGAEGIEAIFKALPDMAIVNMDLAAVSGLSRLGQHEQASVEIVFLSQWATFAYESFRFGASDFLLKPFQYEELLESYERVAKKVADKNALKTLEKQ